MRCFWYVLVAERPVCRMCLQDQDQDQERRRSSSSEDIKDFSERDGWATSTLTSLLDDNEEHLAIRQGIGTS